MEHAHFIERLQENQAQLVVADFASSKGFPKDSTKQFKVADTCWEQSILESGQIEAAVGRQWCRKSHLDAHKS